MQLSRLEIKGFKSFGDKVTINFNEGITGIVGPNGCGKSNVVDSIRWVLGEQRTRALRSDKMENIIFNGTKNRKALQMAEVSITFDNNKGILPTEYTQVTITRRYYRSGESEYLLNGVVCRLKDVQSIFLDTGIGPDSYAIIELKMIDDLLNDKDGSRRELFEEAAGIAKFKIRRKQTLKKLEDTDADLARVEDLLFEIEKNLKSLEKQAKQAEKYYGLKNEYKELSVELAKITVSQFKANFDKIQQRIQDEKVVRTQFEAQIAQKDAEIEKEKLGLVSKEKLVQSRQKAVNEIVNKIRQYESEKKIKNERLRNLTERSNFLNEQLVSDKKSNERAEFSIKSLSDEKSSIEKQTFELEAIVDELKNNLDEVKIELQTLQEQYEDANKALREKKDLSYNATKNVEIARVQLVTLKQELERMQSDSSEQTAGLADFQNKIEQLSKEISIKNNMLSDLQEREEQIQDHIASLEIDIENIKNNLAKDTRSLDSKQNEFNLTKSLVENLEGFPEAVKFLKKNVEWVKEAPLLSDIIFTQENYRQLIENYLEPYMNYYVLETSEDAVKSINLLSDSAKGKANFFVLSSFKNFIPKEYKNLENCTPALSIVEFEEKHKQLFEFLLEQVYIYSGNQDSIPDKHEGVFITENGKLVKRKYSYSGGSVGLFEGKRIGRAKNLEKLEKDILTLTHNISIHSSELTQKQSVMAELKQSTKKPLIENLVKELTLLNNELITYSTKKEQVDKLLEDSSYKKENILEKIYHFEEELAKYEPHTQATEKQLQDLEIQLNELHESYKKAQKTHDEKSTYYNQQNISFLQLSNKLKSTEQEIEFKIQSLENSKERIDKSKAEIAKIDEEIKLIIETTDVQDDELVEMYREKEAVEQAMGEAEKEYYSSRGIIDTLEKEAKEFQKSKDNIDTLLNELNLSLNESVLGFTSVKERLKVEFELDIDQIIANSEDFSPNFSAEIDLRAKVEQVKLQMERIGPINPMAMEAYNEISERHIFITTQKDDLINAKNSLKQTIAEIDTVARETFMDAFTRIRENFIKVFRSLFSEEDSCDLKLVNPNDPTESDIDIIAKPKGKRPLTINQLSGGEKTLTAISLLFSIYLLKPAPFCIFDEVDAPLDDANIDKFNNIIRKFSDESQFIIVTHNKRTMASTDVIYGVTMIEQGVSRVVPVDLRELN
ncbi:MAG: chromosome segregation protein SMC [Cytophagales bacterium]